MAAFETRFLQGKTTPMSRLARLADLQGRVRRSAFQDIQRREIGEVLDKFACRIEAQVKLFDNIETKSSSPVEKAISVLKLFTGLAIAALNDLYPTVINAINIITITATANTHQLIFIL